MEKLNSRLCVILILLTITSLPRIAFSQNNYAVFDEGVAKFKSKNYDAVISDFSGLLSNPAHDKKLDEDLYYYRGQAYYFTGEYEKSLRDLREALALDHYEKGITRWYMARCHDKLGKTQEATAEYKQAAGLLEKNRKLYPEFLADRAQFHSRQGDQNSAQADLAVASSIDPKYQNAKLDGTPKKTRTAGEEKSTPQVIVSSKPKREEVKSAGN